MKVRDRLGLSKRRQGQLVRAMQVGMVLVLVAGLLQGKFGIVVNSSVGLAVTFVPALLRRDARLTMDVGLVLWITTAMFLHALGVLTLPGTSSAYRSVWWWDHVTHALSSSLVAAVGYATARALSTADDDLVLPPRFMFVYLLVFVMAFGVVWELVEFLTSVLAQVAGSQDVLTQYGLGDTMLDLMYNTLGGLLVAVWGTAYLTDVSGQLADRLTTRRAAE
ncbi:hypothetical protein [Halomarina ordinaria]|uniref:DUF2238 domain-containing protein n=1 Tax=Halomarina ordinaria TaxID=3033939 RepID=A0ABD5U9U4_9EURY|nr:hypothetical protein [Halomarina sp. PSRA2]